MDFMATGGFSAIFLRFLVERWDMFSRELARCLSKDAVWRQSNVQWCLRLINQEMSDLMTLLKLYAFWIKIVFIWIWLVSSGRLQRDPTTPFDICLCESTCRNKELHYEKLYIHLNPPPLFLLHFLCANVERYPFILMFVGGDPKHPPLSPSSRMDTESRKKKTR